MYINKNKQKKQGRLTNAIKNERHENEKQFVFLLIFNFYEPVRYADSYGTVDYFHGTDSADL